MPIKSMQCSLLKAMEESQVRSIAGATTQALCNKGIQVDSTQGIAKEDIEEGD